MTAMAKGWTPRERALLMLCVASLGISIAGYLDLGGSAGGAPRGSGGGGLGDSITSGEIRNGTIRSADIGPTIRSVDIVDGGILARDLGLYTNRLHSSVFVPATTGIEQGVTAACDAGDKVLGGGFRNLQPQSVAITNSAHTFPPEGWFVQGRQVGQTGGFIVAAAVCLND